MASHPELVKLLGLTDAFPSLNLSPLVQLMSTGEERRRPNDPSPPRRLFGALQALAEGALGRAWVQGPVFTLGSGASVPRTECPAACSAGLKCEFGTQTPTHFIEKNIDVSYDWNVWSLRRKALRLANLRQCKTHSAQTVLSHFRRDNDTQTWVPKATSTQTASNKGTTMPKKMQYIAGLRGSPQVRMNVCRLELDLGQPHQL